MKKIITILQFSLNNSPKLLKTVFTYKLTLRMSRLFLNSNQKQTIYT